MIRYFLSSFFFRLSYASFKQVKTKQSFIQSMLQQFISKITKFTRTENYLNKYSHCNWRS